MKEHPILFSAPMVRAILAGTKTQTRRVVKPQPHHGQVGRMANLGGTDWAMDDGDLSGLWRCPYGQPGDRLWVRETWAAVHFSFDHETGYCDDLHGSHDIPPAKTPYWTPVYAADDYHEKHIDDRGFPWRPSIHMPRWASRITLEIVSVRVERLNEISEDDAMAEGVETTMRAVSPSQTVEVFKDYFAPGAHHQRDARGSFSSLWESINGAGSWDANPWVWVVEFKVVSQ